MVSRCPPLPIDPLSLRSRGESRHAGYRAQHEGECRRRRHTNGVIISPRPRESKSERLCPLDGVRTVVTVRLRVEVFVSFFAVFVETNRRSICTAVSWQELEYAPFGCRRRLGQPQAVERLAQPRDAPHQHPRVGPALSVLWARTPHRSASARSPCARATFAEDDCGEDDPPRDLQDHLLEVAGRLACATAETRSPGRERARSRAPAASAAPGTCPGNLAGHRRRFGLWTRRS